ncbi:MAG: site-specific integrase, partial [Rouxiella badensis]|uniref:tyrosine-type recombinase/integrase n=1 Tax=Rouxiella badensis TaxID=1646377 RepID=UPI003C3E6418
MKFTLFERTDREKRFGVRYWLNRKKPVKTLFRTKQEALDYQARLQKAFAAGGIAALAEAELEDDIAEAKRLARESGRHLLELVKLGLAASRKGSTEGPTLREAFDGFMRRNAEVKLRSSSVEFYTEQLERFMLKVGDGRRAGEITRELIAGFMGSRPIASRPHCLTAIRAWFGWMLRQEPPLVRVNPTAGMGVEIHRGDRKVAFLVAAESERLLTAAIPKLKPVLALMLFAGIRVEELWRPIKIEGEDALRWEDIDFAEKTIHVRAEVAKTGVARTMRNIPTALWAWIEPGRGKKGYVCAFSLRKPLEQARRAAGLSKWAKSILRHTCASHHAAAFEDLSATALLLRHEGDVALLNRRYREGVHISQAAGLLFFYGIQPQAFNALIPNPVQRA